MLRKNPSPHVSLTCLFLALGAISACGSDALKGSGSGSNPAGSAAAGEQVPNSGNAQGACGTAAAQGNHQVPPAGFGQSGGQGGAPRASLSDDEVADEEIALTGGFGGSKGGAQGGGFGGPQGGSGGGFGGQGGQGGAPGGAPGGSQGGAQGGYPGGQKGQAPGMGQGNCGNAQAGGMPGGSQGGMPGGSQGGMPGGSQGGMPGGSQGGMPGGSQGGATQGGSAPTGSAPAPSANLTYEQVKGIFSARCVSCHAFTNSAASLKAQGAGRVLARIQDGSMPPGNPAFKTSDEGKALINYLSTATELK